MVSRVLTIKMVLWSIYVSAQFNTLTYTAPSEIEKENTVVEPKAEKNETRKKKKLFSFTIKSDLKKEIDSLKTMIKNINAEKKSTDVEEKIKEAVSEALKKNYRQSNSLQSIKKMDYVEEYKSNENITKVAMPIDGKLQITSPFGFRTHPIFGGRKMHNGVDIGANYQKVYSVLDGIISEAGWDSKGGGNYIKVKHSDRFETAYLHLSEIYYKVGERVKAGFIIGKSGNSGNSTGPHLHFAVKEWGKHINPIHFLNDLVFANNLIYK